MASRFSYDVDMEGINYLEDGVGSVSDVSSPSSDNEAPLNVISNSSNKSRSKNRPKKRVVIVDNKKKAGKNKPSNSKKNLESSEVCMTLEGRTRC